MNKKLRLIELFGGYGAQHFSLEYLGLEFEQWKLCEWAVKSIQAYKDAHCKDDNTDYSKDLCVKEIVDFLYNKHISMNYNEPMSYEQIERLGEEKQRTIYNNIIATHNLVDIQQVKGTNLEIKDTDNYDYIMTYSYPCITEDSLILTKDGYKEFRDLRIGEYVLTKSNTWQKISKKFDNGVHKTYYLQGMGFENIHCTANHKFLVRTKYRKGHKSVRCFTEPKFKEVKDIDRDDYFGVPVIQEEVPFYTNDLDFWYMIGYYLGDGWLATTGSDVILACNESKLEKLKSHLDVNKWHYTYHWNSSCYRLRFANKEIYEFIQKHIGTGSFEKKICGEFLRLPKIQLKALLDGYIDSDGCRIKKNIQFSSVNRELIYGVSAIINKVYNRTTCISKNMVKPKTIIQGRVVNQHDWYLLRFKEIDDKQDRAFYENGYLWFPFTKLIESKEEHVYNMEIENDHSYIIQGCISKNCQDLSLAGLGKGMSEESGTRSSLLWEVRRLLSECKELGTLPKYLILENVPQAHGTKNINDFNKWCDFLKSLGYTNTWTDLNAKNYYIPQNRERCFMVSVLDADGKYFKFPQGMRLDIRLKDLLEDEVDEKYYLSDKIVSKLAIKSPVPNDTTGIDLNDTNSVTRDVASTIKARYDCGYEHFSPGPTGVIEPQLKIIAKTEDGNNFNTVYSDNGISPTLLARDYKDPVRVATDAEELVQVAQMYPNSGNPQAGRVYDKSGLSPCLDTCQGGNREVKIVESACTDLQKSVVNQAVDYLREGDVIDYTYSNSRLEEIKNNNIKTRNSKDNSVMCTLTTSCENFGVAVEEPRICASRGRNPENPNSREKGEHLEQRIELDPEGLSNTLTTAQKEEPVKSSDSSVSLNTIDRPSVKQNLRIRKLTPKEAFRLMGVKDQDFENIAKNQSNASLYHLAGDSIVTTCLMAIFGELFKVDYRAKIKELLKQLAKKFDWDSVGSETLHEKANLFDGLFD